MSRGTSRIPFAHTYYRTTLRSLFGTPRTTTLERDAHTHAHRAHRALSAYTDAGPRSTRPRPLLYTTLASFNNTPLSSPHRLDRTLARALSALNRDHLLWSAASPSSAHSRSASSPPLRRAAAASLTLVVHVGWAAAASPRRRALLRPRAKAGGANDDSERRRDEPPGAPPP